MTKDRNPAPLAVSRRIDTAPLDRLLHMAGPLGSSAILLAFLEDLKSVENGLSAAWNGPDFAALRAQAHVLVALAGTVGDTELQALAQNLNTLAHGQDAVEIRATGAHIMTGLAELILTVGTMKQAEA